MQASSRGQLSVRLARESGFHRKIYLIRKPRSGSLFVGSSNLTADGLFSGGEFNLRLTLPPSSVELKRMIQMFDEYWERDSLSVAFSKRDVAAYRRLRGAGPKPFIDNSALAKLISSRHREADQDKAPGTVAYWRDSVSGYASERTASIVHEETNWDKKGYLWFTPNNGRHGYRVGDRILLFDRVAKWAYLIAVAAVTTLPRRTVDGRHFVAFVRDRKTHRRKIGNALWGKLSDASVPIAPRNSHLKSRVSPKQWERILTIF